MAFRLGAFTAALTVAALLQPAPLAAVDYEFDLTYDPAESVVAGTQVISFSRSEMADFAGGRAAVLALLNNAGAIPNPHANPLIEDASYQDGFEAGYTRITGIVDAHGAEVPFEELPLAGRRRFTYPIPGLAVRLRLPPRERYRLTVTFRTRLPALRAGDLTSLDGVFVQRFAWYPRLYPDPDRYTLPPIDGYRVRIVVPHGYRVISHDERASPVQTGTAYVIESRTPAATIPLTIFPEGRFRLVEAASADAEVRLFHRPGREHQARKLAGYAAEALDHYARTLGPLDYRRVTIVEGVRPGAWGMAADAFVMLGSGALNADVPSRDLWDRVLEFLVAHEIGHFYFGIGTPVDFISDNWLSESLTQYVTLDYLEGKYGADDNLFPDDAGAAGVIAGRLLADDSFRERLVTRFHALRKAGFDFPVGSDVDAQNQNGLTAVIYDKGALAVRQLATEMGKDAFDEALGEYARRYRHRFVDTDLFLAHLEEHRPGMRSVGEQVLTTDRYPDYAVAGVAYAGEVARITIRDHGDSGLTAPVRVVVEGGGEDERTLDFTVRGTQVLEVAGRVRSVEIDPAWHTLDVDRKNNHHPRRLSWVVRQHSRHEADLVGIDLRLFELSPDTLRLGAGLDYQSTGMVSYGLSAGAAARIEPGGSRQVARHGAGGGAGGLCRSGAVAAARRARRRPLHVVRRGRLARLTRLPAAAAHAAGGGHPPHLPRQRPVPRGRAARRSAPRAGAVDRAGFDETAGSHSPLRIAAAAVHRAATRRYLVTAVELGGSGAAAHPPARVRGAERRPGRRLAAVRHRHRAAGWRGKPAAGRRRQWIRGAGGHWARVRRPGPAGPAGRRARGPDPGPGGVPQPHGRALRRGGEPLHGVPGARRRPRLESARGYRAECRPHLADRPAACDRRRAGRAAAHRRRPLDVAGVPVGEPAAPPLHPASGRLIGG